MKRWVCLLLMAAVLLLPGCGNKGNETSSAADVSSVASASEPEPAVSEPPVVMAQVVNIQVDSYVNIRGGASLDAPVIGRANNGEQFEYIADGSTDDWKKVNFKGQEGYIFKDYIAVPQA